MYSEYQQFEHPDAIGANLTEAQRALRDWFCQEYLVDFSPVNAAMRIGYNRAFAIEYATKLMEEPYVQRKIQELQGLKLDPKIEEEYNKQRIKNALMREAFYKGPGASHAARVSALAKLGAIYGMEAPKKTENMHTHKGGVMAVPGIASLDSWEQAASGSQANLMQDADVDRR